ncbi:16S rRNA (cytosine(967)-C(5))-methyltransferase RsmB [Candidatus Avoscillospira sp. LCP25S3_F1]|uniref:16S rRNA (cytosine(967)-C(5))-methyltransferase RsmB n=1 Tax=Candidatus Avoscillospira sp. LCP25S3_F1 TaxID=3438825 RepID=UPI003F8EB612
MSARNTALAALIACRKNDAWSDGILKDYIRRDRLDSRDAALATRLCYGVVQNRLLLDFYLTEFVKGGVRKLQPVVQDILRLGVYQIVFMDRIPPSAAVNEAVEQGKRYANPRAAGLVNGVLRSVLRAGENLPQPTDLATRYSHPAGLVELLQDNVGEDLLEPLLQSHNTAPATVVQVNPLKTTEADLCRRWDEQGVAYVPHPWMPGCYELSGTGNLEQMDTFRDGSLLVQDAAAKLPAVVADIEPGMSILDCCAAPGGKSFAAAMALQNRGKIISCDIHPHKIQLIEKGAERLGIETLTAQVQDASAFNPQWENAMDVVLADVPCSGLGTIRKKPDIRYKALKPLEGLPAVQRRILDNVCRYVRPGGVLVYSTCTILRRENEDIVDSFLQEHPDFAAERMALPEGLGAGAVSRLTLLPCVHQCDGFFVAKLRKLP